MVVQFNKDTYEYFVKEKIGRQTFYMVFQRIDDISSDSYYFNVYMTLYTKRKHVTKNEAEILWTGDNPLQTALVARQAFNELEDFVIKRYSYVDIIIYCTWLDNKRRNVYEKFLTQKGYQFGFVDGIKALYKRY